MCSIFEMVKYHGKEYPDAISMRCEEITAHFDVSSIEPELPNYSLHTEYSYGKRKFNSILYEATSELALAHKGGVPQLWKNEQWSIDFAKFIFKLTQGKPAPTVIEIHPPFSDYTDSLESFENRYKIFEDMITERFPDVQILIENRSGSVYQGGKFMLSKIDSLVELSNIIDRDRLNLRFAFDFPQLYTAHNCNNSKANEYFDLINKLEPIKHNIFGVHLWGKRNSPTGRKVAHCGDLHSYFEWNEEICMQFLKEFTKLFSDGQKRKLVLEVNSGNEDLQSIISDLISVGVKFESF